MNGKWILATLVTDDECGEEDGAGHGGVDAQPHIAHQGHLLAWNARHISDQQLWPGYGQVMARVSLCSLLTWGEEQRGPGECLHQQRGEVGQTEAEHQPAHTRVKRRPGPGH